MSQHFYKGLDESVHHRSQISFVISPRELAEKVCNVNYGLHRLLSHIVDVRREQLEARIARYEAIGDYDLADSERDEGDPLMSGIKILLDKGLD